MSKGHGGDDFLPPLPRTLILDYYDSYTNNLLTLFTQLYSDQEVLSKVVIVKADRYTWPEFQNQVLPHIDCVILSPGPGRPDNPSDIGFALDLLRSHPLPILGVCLGHQAIGVAFGAKIINTPRITHGHVIPISPVFPARGLFASKAWQEDCVEGEGLGFDVVVYNSLTIDPESLPSTLEVTAWSDLSIGKKSIQAISHLEHPIWGVQYHPESISSTRGAALLQSFLEKVNEYHSRPTDFPRLNDSILSACAFRSIHSDPTTYYICDPSSSATFSDTSSTSQTGGVGLKAGKNVNPKSTSETKSKSRPDSKPESLRLVEKRFGSMGKGIKTQEVFEKVVRGVDGSHLGQIWLDGETPSRPTTTSLCVPSFILTYSLSSRTVTLYRKDLSSCKLRLKSGETFWDWFSDGQAALESLVITPSCFEQQKTDPSPASHGPETSHVGEHRAKISPDVEGVPAEDRDKEEVGGWKAGWVGWFTYEMKAESLDGYRTSPSDRRGQTHEEERVDACWAWSSTLLERREDGEWIARGVLESIDMDVDTDVTETQAEGSSPISPVSPRSTVTHSENSSSLTDKDDISLSLVSWLLSNQVSFSVSADEFERYVMSTEKILNPPTPQCRSQSQSKSKSGLGSERIDPLPVPPSPSSSSLTSTLTKPATAFPTFRPNNSGNDYRQKIDRCRENIRQGESYELTLTTQFHASLSLESTSNPGAGSCCRSIQVAHRGKESKSEDEEEDEYGNAPYRLYLRLRAFNPAYYSTWISFPSIATPTGRGIHVLSSSPERFLRITHTSLSSSSSYPPNQNPTQSKCAARPSSLMSSSHPSTSLDAGIHYQKSDELNVDPPATRRNRTRKVEMKPIKGTRARVKIGECVCVSSRGCGGLDKGNRECLEEGRRVDILRGQELQADLKERAENLMIVDLIRSDLLSSCTPSTVKVPQLIALETYGVHNLVTTVSGQLREDVGTLQAVKKCFPPGSMTGAPKLRSVQLLDDLEDGVKRGIYSGALGYISICGAVDLSVVIRTIIVEGNQLSLGAGGAVTWLSDRDGEWDEVLTKVKSVVGKLEGVP